MNLSLPKGAILPFAILAFAAAGCDQASSPGEAGGYTIGKDETIILRVNDKEVPEARVSAYAPPGVEVNEQVLEQVTNNIIVSELLLAEALANELHKSVEVREQLEVARQNVLGRALVSKLLEGAPVSEDEIQSRYSQLSSDIQGNNEYNAKHILVETEEEAKEIIAQIEADISKFEEIAKEQSKDPGSGQNGGSLGWASAETYVPEFSEAMKALGKGEFTKEPVRSQFGWHVIAVDDIRSSPVPELDGEIRERITASIQNEMISAYIDDLRSKANIVEVN